MDQEERYGDQQKRLAQRHHRQNEHVGEVKSFPGKEDGVFTLRMAGAFQVIVGREEEALNVSYEDIVEGEQRVKEERVDVLEPVVGRAGLMGRKSKDASSGKGVVFASEVDTGVV